MAQVGLGLAQHTVLFVNDFYILGLIQSTVLHFDAHYQSNCRMTKNLQTMSTLAKVCTNQYPTQKFHSQYSSGNNFRDDYNNILDQLLHGDWHNFPFNGSLQSFFCSPAYNSNKHTKLMETIQNLQRIILATSWTNTHGSHCCSSMPMGTSITYCRKIFGKTIQISSHGHKHFQFIKTFRVNNES